MSMVVWRLIYWLVINVVAMWAAVMVLPGIRAFHIMDILWAGVMLAIVNGTLGPIVRLLTCPLRLLTMGLFSLVVNWLLFLFAAWLSRKIGASIVIDNVWWALAGAVIVSVIVGVGGALTRPVYRYDKG